MYMKDFDDNIALPSAQELEAIQKALPNLNLIPIDPEAFAKGRGAFKREQEEMAEYPILRPTPEGLGLFAAQQDLQKSRLLFLQKLEYTPLKAAIEDWLRNLQGETRRNYAYYVSDLMRRGIVPETDAEGNVFTVGHFNHIPHEQRVDYIKTVQDWSEGTRQVRAACYISLTAYLGRISQGWFRKAEPSTLASNKTFYSVRDKCATRALSLHDWHRFIAALYQINERDALIAKTMLQGAKRISEALSLRIDQIDFDKRLINFKQSKTGGTLREIPITYPVNFIAEMQEYIEKTREDRGSADLVFITNKGKGVFRTQLNATFDKASKAVKLPKINPHVLRATWVTLAKEQGVPDSEIMKVTGHTSAKMIYAYDKKSAAENYSKKLVLV